jgi:hypothetical protein
MIRKCLKCRGAIDHLSPDRDRISARATTTVGGVETRSERLDEAATARLCGEIMMASTVPSDLRFRLREVAKRAGVHRFVRRSMARLKASVKCRREARRVLA